MNTIELIEPELKPTRFTDKDAGAILKLDGEPFILAQVDSGTYSLISLIDGNRYEDEADILKINKIIVDKGFRLIGLKCKITIEVL